MVKAPPTSILIWIDPILDPLPSVCPTDIGTLSEFPFSVQYYEADI